MGSTSSTSIQQLIANAAAQYGVPSQLAVEVAIQESGLNQNAVSSAGAIGVMQLMPSTAGDLGVDPTNLAQNIAGGVRYLAQLISQYGGDQQKALAAYNWGEGNVNQAVASGGTQWFSLIPSSVQHYVTTILQNAGTAYQVQPTPPSASNPASPAGPAPASSPAAVPSWILPVGVGALGLMAAYIFADSFTDLVNPGLPAARRFRRNRQWQKVWRLLPPGK